MRLIGRIDANILVRKKRNRIETKVMSIMYEKTKTHKIKHKCNLKFKKKHNFKLFEGTQKLELMNKEMF